VATLDFSFCEKFY